MKREDLPLGILLTTLNDAFRQRLFEGYEAAGFGDVRPAYHVVFELLSWEGERVIEVIKPVVRANDDGPLSGHGARLRFS